MLRHRSYLTEAVFDIQMDVDWLYEKSGLSRLEGALKTGDIAKIEQAFSWIFKKRILLRTDSSKLRSVAAKRAHEINPVSILVQKKNYAPVYRPPQRERVRNRQTGAVSLRGELKPGSIEINVPSSFIKIIQTAIQRRDDAYIDKRLVHPQIFRKMFEAGSLKGTIAHELSHWVNDSLNNWAVSIENVRRKRDGLDDSNQMQAELDAQIHNIAQIKHSLGDAYEAFTWTDLFQTENSLTSNFQVFHRGKPITLGPKDFDKMMRRFAQRMRREGLLTKPMQKLMTRTEFVRGKF